MLGISLAQSISLIQLFVFGKSIQEVEKELNSDIENASKWYQDNFLIANKDKYQAMFIRENKPNDKEIEVKLNEIEIEQTSSITLLGVSIDDRLNFTEHIKNVSTKASQRVGVIFRLRNLIPTCWENPAPSCHYITDIRY